MNRKKLLSGYTRHWDADGNETYTYTGPRYALGFPPGKRRQVIFLCWLAPAAALGLFVCMGLLGTRGSYAAYVALPYVSIFMPTALLFGDAYKLARTRGVMREAEYSRSVVQMRRCTLAGAAVSAATLAGQTAFLFAVRVEDSAREWLFWFLCLALLAVFLGFLSAQKRMNITICR